MAEGERGSNVSMKVRMVVGHASTRAPTRSSTASTNGMTTDQRHL
jgi:hypothetical protein